MGSVIPKSRTDAYACGLFLEIHRQVRLAEQRGEEPDVALVAELMADAIAHPDSRKSVLQALASYVVISMSCGAPDPESFCKVEK